MHVIPSLQFKMFSQTQTKIIIKFCSKPAWVSFSELGQVYNNMSVIEKWWHTHILHIDIYYMNYPIKANYII